MTSVICVSIVCITVLVVAVLRFVVAARELDAEERRRPRASSDVDLQLSELKKRVDKLSGDMSAVSLSIGMRPKLRVHE